MTLAQDGMPSQDREDATEPGGVVVAVSCNGAYTFTKPVRDEIALVAGHGVEGDVHAGVRVRHRHRVRIDPTQPNLRQVHLIQGELFDEVAGKGYEVSAGQLGENVTTSGIDLLALPLGTILRFGPRDAGAEVRTAGTGSGSSALAGVFDAADAAQLDEAVARAVIALRAAADREAGDDPRPAVVLTGLRNPCVQINKFRRGLLKEMIGRDAGGEPVQRAGVMAVVLRGGAVRAGDLVGVELPPPPLRALERV